MVDILSILSSLASAFVGAGFGAYWGHCLARRRDVTIDDQRRKSIAITLRTELEANRRLSPDIGLLDLDVSLNDNENRLRLPSTRLYDANIGELGRFCPNAVQPVILAYSTTYRFTEEAERVRHFIEGLPRDRARLILTERSLTEEEREKLIEFRALEEELMERIDKAIDFLNREVDS